MTDNLYNKLNVSKRDRDEIIVVDNGSSNIAKHTTHRVDTNCFFGGAFNVILDYFLNETKQEYLFVINNDILYRGNQFTFNIIENEISENKLDVYSPSIINTSITQCHWKQMLNWNTKTVRLVKWIDFQSPILSRDICQIINQYPDELIYGWGLDFYTGIIANTHNMKTGVSDNIVFTHMDGQTFKQNAIDIGISQFCYNAEKNMNEYFLNSEYNSLYHTYRKYGEDYDIFYNSQL